MRRRHLVIGITTGFFAAGVFPVGSVKAESATITTEQTTVTRELIALLPENDDRATLTAVLAEKQAVGPERSCLQDR